MVANLFEGLLQDLGKIIGIPLFPDSNNSCLIKLKNGVHVQFELDRHSENLMIGADLGSIPMGRYRTNVFREALRANGLLSPNHGILAFSPKADRLVLFMQLPLPNLNAERISFQLGPFSEKALLWQNAITHGDIPIISSTPSTTPSGLFGLKR